MPGLRRAIEAGRGQKGGKPGLAFAIIGLTLVLGLLSYPSYLGLPSARDKASLASAAGKLPSAYTPLRLQIVSASADGLRVRIKFLDLSGGELSLIERSFEGQSLGLEFYAKRLALGHPSTYRTLLFPRILRGKGGASGASLLLFDAYDREGFPGIFDSRAGGAASLSEDERRALSRAFTSAKAAKKPLASSRLIVLLSGLEAGKSYKVEVDSGGEASLLPASVF